MPIHDQTYRRYGGQRVTPGGAWIVIAAAGIRTMLAKRRFLALMVLAWVPFFVRSVQVYIAANFSQASMLAPTPGTFRSFLEQQDLFVFFVTIYVGAGLIANDRRANALQIYLSKPLTRAEYVGGKLAILLVFLSAITWVPGLFLLLTQTMLTGSLAFLRENLFLVPAITLFGLIEVLLAAFTMLALSSLSNSGRFVAVLYAGVVLFSNAMFQALRGVTGSSGVSWLSVSASLAQVGDVIFRLPPRYETPWLLSVSVVLILMMVSMAVVVRRVRGIEVVT